MDDFDRIVTAVLILSIVLAIASGLGLLIAALGIGRSSGWRQRWGVWLPSVFGASLAAAPISYVLLLLFGSD